MKGLRNTSRLLQNGHGDIDDRIGNVVNNIVITMIHMVPGVY